MGRAGTRGLSGLSPPSQTLLYREVQRGRRMCCVAGCPPGRGWEQSPLCNPPLLLQPLSSAACASDMCAHVLGGVGGWLVLTGPHLAGQTPPGQVGSGGWRRARRMRPGCHPPAAQRSQQASGLRCQAAPPAGTCRSPAARSPSRTGRPCLGLREGARTTTSSPCYGARTKPRSWRRVEGGKIQAPRAASNVVGAAGVNGCTSSGESQNG